MRLPHRIVAALLALGFVALGLPGAACDEPDKPTRTRESAIAGSWYPGHAVMIASEIDLLTRITRDAPTPPGRPVALLVPHAGWQYSGAAAAAAFRLLKPGDFDRVVVVAPSHRGSFRGFSIPDVASYRTPVGEIPLCATAVRELLDGELIRSVAGVHDSEHSIEIELPFLQERLDSFLLVPVLAGHTDGEQQRALAERLAKLDDGRTLFVFSSDFTHYGPRYGYTPFERSAMDARGQIRSLDRRAVSHFAPPDAAGFRAFLTETGDTICGRDAVGVMLELLPLIAPDAKPVLLSHYASIDMAGMEDENSVSYYAYAWTGGEVPEGAPLGPPPPERTVSPSDPEVDAVLGDGLVRVARASIETAMDGGPHLREALRGLPADREELLRVQAVFVTLNRTDPEEIAARGRLRGCIGQVSPSYRLAQAVVVAAVQAALADRRFTPVTAEELPGLEVEVSVLTPARPVGSWKEIEIGKHGVILRKDGSSAVFLPHVAMDQGWSLEETLTHLARKAGLSPSAWRDGATFEVFETRMFVEHEEESHETDAS
jgi:AmmeMemoRadiSam system protein B/AmmeMemoRadiSam system protein A